MNLTLILGLVTIVGVYLASRAPNQEDLVTSFQEAQRFYAEGAYDQAIAQYEAVSRVRSRMLDVQNVTVTVAGETFPIQETAIYQIGNAYTKLYEDFTRFAGGARDESSRSRFHAQADSAFVRAVVAFRNVITSATDEALRVQAYGRLVELYFKAKAYQEVITAAQGLIIAYPDNPRAIVGYYNLGWAYYEMKEYTRAIKAFETLLDHFPTGYQADRSLFQIGESYYDQGSYEQAIPWYQRLVARQRIDELTEVEIREMQREKTAGLVDETALELAAKAQIRIGDCYARLARFDEAAQTYRRVETVFSGERRLMEEAYLREADMYYNRGDFEACVAVYRRAIEAVPDLLGKARMQLLLANRYFETEHYQEAVREYDHYRDAYGKVSAQAGLSLEGVGLKVGRAWLREAEKHSGGEELNAYRQAEIELRQTLTSYPKSGYEIELTFNLGLALQMQHDSVKTEEALTLFKNVIDSPSAGVYRQSALFQTARIDHSLKTYDEAATVYRQVITELTDKPEVDIAFFELGIVERDRGAWQMAVEEFLKVRPGASLFARSRFEAGQLLVLHDEHKRAIGILEEGLAAETALDRLAFFHYLLGSAHSRLGDYEHALPHFDKAVPNVPATLSERVAYGRGVTLVKLGRYADAVRDLDRTWSDPEIVVSAPHLLAAAYTALGRTDDALRIYRGLTLSTGTPLERGEYFLALAEIYQRQGRYAEVIEACQALLNLKFDEPTLPAERPYYLWEKAFFLLSEASVRLQDFERAAAEAASGLVTYENAFYTPDFLFLRGLALLQLDKNGEAATYLTQMVERYPTHANAGYAYYYLGYAYFKQTLFAKAILPFKQVTDRFADLDVASDALFRIAECLYNLGRYEEAQRDYQKVVDRYPTSSMAEDAMYNIIWCLMNEIQRSTSGAPTTAAATDNGQRITDVRKAINTYLSRYPAGRHVATARYTLAELNFNEGEYTLAYDLFRRIEQDFPGSPAAQKAVSALPDLREALAYHEYSAVMEVFGRATQQNSKELFREAILRFEEVWKKYPETMSGVGAKINVGVCYQYLDEWKQAVAAFDVIITEGKRGHTQITPDVMAFCQRRRDTIARKHL